MPSNQKAPETICEAAVLGLGGVGSAAFAELARRGVRRGVQFSKQRLRPV